MDRVSDERLNELISSDEAWARELAQYTEDTAEDALAWHKDRAYALTELRELRAAKSEAERISADSYDQQIKAAGYSLDITIDGNTVGATKGFRVRANSVAEALVLVQDQIKKLA